MIIRFLKKVVGSCGKWLRHGLSGARNQTMFNWSNWPPEFTFSARPEFPHQLPNLRPHLCANGISEATHEYNCIAWAASDTTAWWEPDVFQQYFWPEGVSRDYSLQSYINAFRT